jgi:hypothetical protein
MINLDRKSALSANNDETSTKKVSSLTNFCRFPFRKEKECFLRRRPRKRERSSDLCQLQLYVPPTSYNMYLKKKKQYILYCALGLLLTMFDKLKHPNICLPFLGAISSSKAFFVEVCSYSSRAELFASFWEITRARRVSSFYPELSTCSCYLFTKQLEQNLPF